MGKNKVQKTSEINLLPQEGFSYTTAGRVLNWVLSTFRYIVIFTELIVMTAFFSRFWLDAKNSDLTEEIESYQQRIASNVDFEKKFRGIQERFSLLEKLTQNGKDYPSLYTNILSNIPPEIFLDLINFSSNGAGITGHTGNEMEILQFMVNIDGQKEFKNTTLSQIQPNENTNQINFTINSLFE